MVRGLHLGLLFAVLCTATLGCSEAPVTTQVVVQLDAERGVRARTAALRLGVWGAPATAQAAFEPVLETRLSQPTWPVQLPLVPRDGDAARRFRIEVVAEDGTGAPVATVRADGGYLAAESRLLRLVLEEACVDVSCEETRTCAAGTCVDASVDVASLPRYPTGRSIPDGGMPRADAGPAPRDAGGAMDAAVGPDGGHNGDAALREGGPPQGDAGPADAGSLDSSRPDATRYDASRPDAGSLDSSRPDGGEVDAGHPADGGATDAAAEPCDGPSPGDLVITEVMVASETGAGDLGEWFEVENRRDCTLDLAGLRMLSPTSSGEERSHVVQTLSVAPGERLVFALSADPDTNHDLPHDYAYGSGAGGAFDDVILNNGGDVLELRHGGQLIDRVTYGGGDFSHGVSRQFSPGTDAEGNDDWSGSCDSMGVYFSSANGTLLGSPGQENHSCP